DVPAVGGDGRLEAGVVADLAVARADQHGDVGTGVAQVDVVGAVGVPGDQRGVGGDDDELAVVRGDLRGAVQVALVLGLGAGLVDQCDLLVVRRGGRSLLGGGRYGCRDGQDGDPADRAGECP